MRENSYESSSLDNSYLIEGIEERHYPLPIIMALYSQLVLLVSLFLGFLI